MKKVIKKDKYPERRVWYIDVGKFTSDKQKEVIVKKFFENKERT